MSKLKILELFGGIGAYVTLKIDLTDVSVGAILLESCKSCTTILDFWLE